jgi:hypothetical protein
MANREGALAGRQILDSVHRQESTNTAASPSARNEKSNVWADRRLEAAIEK